MKLITTGHLWARSRVAAVAVAVLLAACASPPKKTETPPDGPLRTVAREARVVVLFEDFGNNSVGSSRHDFEGLTRGLPSLIVNDFLQIGAYRPVIAEDRLKALAEVALSKSGVTGGEGLRIGRMLGARLLLRGEFSESAGLLTITARAIDVETGEVTASIHAFGPTEQAIQPPDALIKRVSLGLMQRLALRLKPEEIEALRANIESTSIHAVDSNYRGEKLAELAELARRRPKDPARAEGDASVEDEIVELDNMAGGFYEEAAASDGRYGRSRRNLNLLQRTSGRGGFAARVRPGFQFGRVLSVDSPRWMRTTPMQARAHKLRTGVITKTGSYSPSHRRASLARLSVGRRVGRRGPGGGIVNTKVVRIKGGGLGKVHVGRVHVGKVRVGGKVKIGKVHVGKVKVKVSAPKFKK